MIVIYKKNLKFNDHQIASDDEQLRQEIYDLCQAGKTYDGVYVWKGNSRSQMHDALIIC